MGGVIPTSEQEAIMKAPLEPLRVAAGAGTGKTTTIALRVSHLLASTDLEPEEVLGITFTNKAAAELADRIRTLAGTSPGREVEVHTYHGFAAQILREFGAMVGIERDAAIITPTFARQILFGIIASSPLPDLNVTDPRTLERLRNFGSELGDHLLSPIDVALPSHPQPPWPERMAMLKALELYTAEKRRLGVTDYSDLILFAHRLVRRHHDVADRIRARFRLVVLDEYQDTNPAQRELLRAIFPPGHGVTAVGDADQTIYEWRGASLENFVDFTHHFPRSSGRPARSLSLTLNRRSGHHIISVANLIREGIGGESDRLRPLHGAPLGRVVTRYERDAVTEAGWIAAELVRIHHAEQIPWREMAILVRKNKDLPLLHDALKAMEIPVEVANLGGLLAIPEVADLHAWLRLLHQPEDSPAFLRLVLGSRFRLGMGAVRVLTEWMQVEDELDLEHGRIPSRTLVEAVDHLESLPLPAEAAAALQQFRSEYRDLLEAAQGVSLVELCRRILDRTGAWRDVEAMSEAARLSARLNLYRFLDLAEDWSPLEGRPSLEAFIDYLATMEDEETEELDAARLSGEDAVALLTVHRAKGLEWEVVTLPALYDRNFPTRAIRHPSPDRFPEYLPYELRIDRDIMPRFDENVDDRHINAVLGERLKRQEWRLAYVGVTRAKSQLIATGAHWYGTPEPNRTPWDPSPLFELIDSFAHTEHAGRAEAGPRPEVLRIELSTTGAPDPLFPDGWADALRRAIADPDSPSRRAAELGVEDQFHRQVSGFQEMLFRLPPAPPVETSAPTETSVTGLVTYASCPRRFFWSEVDRLPRRPSDAARRGVEVHRRIELHNRGQMPLEDLAPDLYDLPGEWSEGADPFEVFRTSRFARVAPFLVEAPFELVVSGATVRGRIDAVYQHPPRHWEVVDFKSGRSSDDPARNVQLEAYALAAKEAGLAPLPPEHLTVTFAYLGAALEERSARVDESWLEAAHHHLKELIGAIAAGRFEPTPSDACHRCDFLRFCPEGRTYTRT